MSDVMMVVGSLNRATPYFDGARGVGLSVFAFDPATGVVEHVSDEPGIDNPTFLSVASGSGCVYANSEVPTWHEGTVTAFRFDPELRRLVYLNKQPTLGCTTSYINLDKAGRYLLVANYGGGAEGDGPDQALVVLPILGDGGLGAPVSSVSHTGSGPDPARQARSHPHCVVQTPDGRFAVMSDLGTDALVSFSVAPGGALGQVPAAVTAMPPGSGPRHLAYHPDRPLAFSICELHSTISTLRYDASTGGFSVSHTVSTLPSGHGPNLCSEIVAHPNGRFVYGANRGHDSISAFRVDVEGGRLEPIGTFPSGGRTPRHIALDPGGRHLVIANQDSDNLSFMVVGETGALAPVGEEVSIGSPMCVGFLKLA